MRILMLAQFYPPIIGGEERHVRSLSQALARAGHDVVVATHNLPGEAPEAIDEAGVRVVRMRGLSQRLSALFSDGERRFAPPFPDPEVTWRLRRIVKDFKPDIVHAHNWIVHSFLPVRPFTKAPLVLTLHDYGMACPKKTLMQGDNLCSGRGFAKCLACSRDQYGLIKGAVTTTANRISSVAERMAVDKFLTVSRAVADGNALDALGVDFEAVPNFIPDSYAADAFDAARCASLPDEPYLLFVGDLRRMKGLDATLQAYAQLERKPPLVLIGRRCPDTPDNLPDGVRLFESWPHADIMEAWRRCGIAVIPSLWPDPCPTVVMEAMSCGKPVVATRSGGIPDMVDDGINGRLVEPGDSDALATALQELIDDNVLAKRMGMASLDKVKGFRASSVVPRILDVYRQARIKRARISAVEERPAAAGSDRGVS